MKIAAIIPCYNVKSHILDVLRKLDINIHEIIVVDDCCPENTADFVKENFTDPRMKIIKQDRNGGVGSATIVGLKEALKGECDIFVKLDGDGQMDPAFIDKLIAPICSKTADYTKGNRFYHLKELKKMPFTRLMGNAALSLITKFSSGYWTISDPTNGFTALHRKAASELELDVVSKRYFFESDMLYHLNQIDAVVQDIAIPAHYADEKSNLKIGSVFFEFAIKNTTNFFKRIYLNYFLKDFSIVTLQIIFGTLFFWFGVIFGLSAWINSAQQGIESSAGTVMLAALPFVIGFQLYLSFLSHDIKSQHTLSLQMKS